MKIRKKLKRLIAGCMAALMTLTMAPDSGFIARAANEDVYDVSYVQVQVLERTENGT